MANIGSVGNWVGETTTTTGTGDIALGGALTGFTTFSSIGETYFWYAVADGNDREAGLGTLIANTLQRTSVYSTLVNGIYSDNSPSAISLSGLAQVFSTFNKTAFDILDDGVESSENHILNQDVHIAASGTVTGDGVEWNTGSGSWVPVSNPGGFLPAGTEAQTIRWNDGAYVATSTLTVDDSGDVTASGNLYASGTIGYSINVGMKTPATDAIAIAGSYVAITDDGGSEALRATSGRIGIGTTTPNASSKLDVNGAIYTESLPLVSGAKRFVVQAALPGTPDADTIYFLTGP